MNNFRNGSKSPLSPTLPLATTSIESFFYFSWSLFLFYRDPVKRTFSTAYLTFSSEADYKEFVAEFNGHTFLDDKGTAYKLQIELALHPKVPSKKQKLPETSGTYTETDDYKQFVERISKEVEKPVSVDQLEEEKTIPQVASLVLDMNEYASTKEVHRSGGGRRHGKGQRAPKEDVKYVIKKRPQGAKEGGAHSRKGHEEAEMAETAAPVIKQRGRGKNGGGGAVIYRKKQPKEETK